MATYVLVSGAWHGGWCWRKVTPLLEAQGHRVYTPTLTGLGARAHLLTREVNLTTHIQDVAALMLAEDMHDVVLAGHSYGGLVISGVACNAKERLSHVAYLDAILPVGGKADIANGDNSHPLVASANASGNGWKIPVPAVANGQLMGVTDTADIKWMLEQLTPHPLASFREVLNLDSQRPHPVPGSYLLCTGDGREDSGFIAHAERARTLGWPVDEINTGHDLMITEPESTAAFLLRSLIG
ncbi:MAG: alpha/beta hydrolase [Chloroflexi bacterium]|nr:alpha/beta hydrolase [Chloroflexota bacterium]